MEGVFGRGAAIVGIQNKIVSFRDEVVRPFEQSMKTLNRLFPGIISTYGFVFCLRFDLLVYRARAVWISDSLRLAQYLAGLEDSSNEVQRLANILRNNAIAETFRCVAYCGQSIASAGSAPCLEVELRLVQNIVKQLGDGGLRELPADGELTKGARGQERNYQGNAEAVMTELNQREGDRNGLPQRETALDLGASFATEHSAHSLTTATTLCMEYPNTAGRFLPIAAALKAPEAGRDLTDLLGMYTVATRLVEKSWGSHILGQLQTCQRGHPYSRGSFPGGCPECGRKVELPDVEFARHARYLHEDKFLEQMARCGLK